MATTGFHSEWVTISGHRILLECRCGFPDEDLRFIAQVAVETVRHNSRHGARVVYIHKDEKNGFINIKIASDNSEDEELAGVVMSVLHAMRFNGDCQSEVVIVEPGDKSSDHYNHDEHLSVGAGVAVNRWKHNDAEYQKDVHPPR